MNTDLPADMEIGPVKRNFLEHMAGKVGMAVDNARLY